MRILLDRNFIFEFSGEGMLYFGMALQIGSCDRRLSVITHCRRVAASSWYEESRPFLLPDELGGGGGEEVCVWGGGGRCINFVLVPVSCVRVHCVSFVRN